MIELYDREERMLVAICISVVSGLIGAVIAVMIFGGKK
jgi:hypothetical protein